MKRILRNLNQYTWNKIQTLKEILLGTHETIDYEVDRAVDNEEEVLDGSEGEHPARVGGEHAQAPAQVGLLSYTGLDRIRNLCQSVLVHHKSSLTL